MKTLTLVEGLCRECLEVGNIIVGVSVCLRCAGREIGKGVIAMGVNEILNEALERGDKKAPSTIAKETLTGDLRDAALDWIRLLKKPWPQLSEDEQRDVIESITKQAIAAATKAVEVIVADGKRVIAAEVDSVTVKDGLKAVVKCLKTEDNLVFLGMAEGARVQIVAADVEPFVGEREPAEAQPDQRGMFDGGEEAAADA